MIGKSGVLSPYADLAAHAHGPLGGGTHGAGLDLALGTAWAPRIFGPAYAFAELVLLAEQAVCGAG